MDRGERVPRRSSRGRKRVAWATPAWLVVPLVPLQPDQKTVGQHDRHRMPVEPGPQAPLVVIPAQLPLVLLMERRDRSQVLVPQEVAHNQRRSCW
jgi:hypothetical protein